MTRAMEAVSAVKMRKTQETALAGRSYARAALSILTRLSQSSDLSKHPLLETRDIRNIALVIITSDKGLAGALNTSVLKAATETLSSYAKEAVTVYPIGKKGEDFFTRRGYRMPKAFGNKSDFIETALTQELSEMVTTQYVAGAYDAVFVAYSNFHSTFEQVATVHQLLPLSVERLQVLVNDIVPHKGRFSDLQLPQTAPVYTIEPDAEVVLAALIPRLVGVSLYHMLLESKASEHSARMVAMKSASDKSKEVAQALTRTYNKVRQAAITREVSEVVSGREALAAQ